MFLLAKTASAATAALGFGGYLLDLLGPEDQNGEPEREPPGEYSRIRSPALPGTPEADRNLRKRLRKICDEIHDPSQGLDEGVAEPRTLGLVPFPGPEPRASR
jgi:hypothetical protein